MEIRQITEDDAAAFLAMQRQLDRETDFMLMAPGERQTTVEQQRDIIDNSSFSGGNGQFLA